MAVFGEQGFGVELHAFHGQCFMAYTHDFAVFRPCGNVQTVGQGGAVDNQAVVAGTGNRVGQAGKHAAVEVVYGRAITERIHQDAAADRANQQKGDSDAASWLPPKKIFRCEYVSRQIRVKKKYSLWVTSAEKDAMKNVLAGC